MKSTLIRIGLYVTLCLVGLIGLATPARANSFITVTTLDDALIDDSACSLREAIIAANIDSAFNGCDAGSGADTILVADTLPAPRLFTLTRTGSAEDGAQTGDLDISGTLTISGTIIIDGNHSDRVLHLLNGATVTLIGVTVRHGEPGVTANGGGILTEIGSRLTASNSLIISNSALSGGGIYGVGRVTLTDSQVEGNTGGGLTNNGGLLRLTRVEVKHNHGGYGITNGSQGSLTFTTGQIEGNQGGGLYNATAQATLTDVTFVGNSGGGAVNRGATLTRLNIANSSIISNTAPSGAGLLNEGTGAIVGIYQTQISGNRATGNGGGLFNNGIMSVQTSTLDHNVARAGAGLFHLDGNLSLVNDTFSQNRADDNGGALYNGGSAVVKAVTFAQNRANGEGGNIFIDESQLSIENSIVAGAEAGGNCVSSGGFVTSLGHNLEGTNSCKFDATGDLPNLDPRLGLLQANGGPTPTHALLADSPAIDGGANCPATDQRGVARPQGAACDIGAYEFAVAADLAIAANVAPPTITVGTRLTYTLTIGNHGPLTATALTLTDELPVGTALVMATVDGGSCTVATPLICTVAQLTPGQSLTTTIVLTAPLTAGPITNMARITATTVDLFPENNQAVTTRIVVTGTTPSDQTPPSQATNLTATALTTQGATISWDAAVDNIGVVGYTIYAQKSAVAAQASGGAMSLLLVGQVNGMTTIYTVTTLQAQTVYQLWVVAHDAAGNVAPLAEATPISIETLALSIGAVQISIEPPLPTDQEPISITVSGVYTSSCTPHYQTHQRADQLIEITSVPSDELFCLPAESPWDYTIGVGVLPVGRYTVTHRLGQVVDQTAFTVTAAVPETLSPPLFQVDGNQTQNVVVGEQFTLLLQATGAPPPTFALVEAPPGMTIDATSGEIVWTPMVASSETITVTVRATNRAGSADYTFTILTLPPTVDEVELFLPLIAKP